MELIAKVAGDEALARRIAAAGAGLRRCDVYRHEGRGIALLIAAGNADEIVCMHDAVTALAGEADLLVLGEGGLEFGFGLETMPPLHAPTGIEIVTRFHIADGQADAFREKAERLTELVREKDPGTSRYDWYFRGDGRFCIALDTYADAAGMLAHMANAHALHAELLAMAGMETEFLGDLSPDARAAVAKYDPFVLPRLA